MLCQAHLYEAKELEQGCLRTIKENFETVVLTSEFGALAFKWPEVMVKITMYIGGIGYHFQYKCIWL